MTDLARLEIGLSRNDDNRYIVDLRFSRPAENVDLPPVRGLALIDAAALRTCADDVDRYARLLTDSLSSDPAVLDSFRQAYNAARSANGRGLRLKLFIDQSASELHSVHWEML